MEYETTNKLISKILIQLALILDMAAAMKICSARVVYEHLLKGFFSSQNIPLELTVIILIIFIEYSLQRKIPVLIIFLLLISSIIFLWSSFYLPPTGDSPIQISVFAYGALMVQLSIALAYTFTKHTGYIKIVLFAVFLTGICTLIGFIYTFKNIKTYRPVIKSDAAVVLGAGIWGKYKPSPVFCGRLNEAADLYKSGNVKKIVVTGGTREFDTFASKAGAWYLKQQGIPDSAIITEHNTFCTCQQAVYIKHVLADSLKFKNIVVVSDKWHLPRALLMCNRGDIKVFGMASNYKMSTVKTIYYRIRESAAIQVYILFGA